MNNIKADFTVSDPSPIATWVDRDILFRVYLHKVLQNKFPWDKTFNGFHRIQPDHETVPEYEIRKDKTKTNS